MPFQAQKFLEDHQVRWFPPGSRNVGRDFIGIKCPFCPDKSSHGGFNIKKSYYSCHACGGHWLPKVIATLAKTNIDNAIKIIKKYSTGEVHFKKQTKHKYISEITYPPGTGPLTDKAKQYLISRNFDPNYLVSEWGLLSTGNIGNYKFSILAPIYLKGRLISYQCRDITGNSIPYKGCPIEESVYFLKYTLYGFDKAILKNKCIVVEGFVDNWRLGPGAVATFGIQFTSQQVLLLAKSFDKIFIMYDEKTEADQEQADKLYHQLTIGYNKNVEILSLDSGDPGDLSDEMAKEIMKEVGL